MKTKVKTYSITATLKFTTSLEIEAQTEEEAKKKALDILERCDLDSPVEVDNLECPDIDIDDIELAD